MSSLGLSRWGGLAAMVAGVLLLIAELLELLPAFDDYPFSELALTGVFFFQQVLYLFGLILLSVGLVGLYVRQSRVAGPLGLVGFLVAFVGTVFFTGFFWANIFVTPALAVGAPEFLDLGGRFPGFFLSLFIYAVGWLFVRACLVTSPGLPSWPCRSAHSRRGSRPPRGAPFRACDRRGLRVVGYQPLLGKRGPGRADLACELTSSVAVVPNFCAEIPIFVQSWFGC